VVRAHSGVLAIRLDEFARRLHVGHGDDAADDGRVTRPGPSRFAAAPGRSESGSCGLAGPDGCRLRASGGEGANPHGADGALSGRSYIGCLSATIWSGCSVVP
jgi:hypothetical protein